MPRGIRQPFPDGWNELKVRGFGWTAVRVSTDKFGLPIGLEIPFESDGIHVAFRRERWQAAADLAGAKIAQENDLLRREVERLRREEERLRRIVETHSHGPLPGGVSS